MYYICGKRLSLRGVEFCVMSCYDCSAEWFTYNQLCNMLNSNPNFSLQGAKKQKNKWVFNVVKM